MIKFAQDCHSTLSVASWHSNDGQPVYALFAALPDRTTMLLGVKQFLDADAANTQLAGTVLHSCSLPFTTACSCSTLLLQWRKHDLVFQKCMSSFKH